MTNTGEEQENWALALSETKQPLGVFPTRAFWYGDIQAKKHFLGKRHFATTMLQIMPVFALLGVIVAIFPKFIYFTFPIGSIIYAGIVETIVRKRIKKNLALRAAPGDGANDPA